MIHAALALRRLTDRRLPAALSLACAACLVLAAIPHPAFAGILLPEHGAGSREADDINTLYVITLFIALPIFVGVEGVLIYSLVRHRARRGAPQPAQVRGNTRLETSWTVAAALILVIIAVFTFVLLPAIRTPERGGLERAGTVQVAAVGQPPVPGGPTMHVRVVGQQYLWRYDYPGPPGSLFSYYDMYVPTKTTVVLNITSSDVVHSWWVPSLGGKADAVPRHTNHTWFRIDKPGIYTGRCAELCGDNHADMRNRVIAVTPEQYQAWAARQRAGIKQSQALLALSRKVRGQQGF
jgi:cytochrome c oxidase subunit II